jgi:hypothetical protein
MRTLALALCLSLPLAACSMDAGEEVSTDESRVSTTTSGAFAPSSFDLELEGQTAGHLSRFTGPSRRTVDGVAVPTDASASFDIGQSLPMLEWVVSAWKRDPAPKSATVEVRGRRVDMTGCLIKEIALPKLEAKDGKKHMQVDFTFEPESVKYGALGEKAASAPAAPAVRWRASVPGLDGAQITSVTLPSLTAKIDKDGGAMRLPTRHYAAWETTGLAIEVAPEGAAQASELAKKVLEDGVVVDVAVEMLDAQDGVVASLVLRSKLQGANAAGTTLNFEVVDMRLDAKR